MTPPAPSPPSPSPASSPTSPATHATQPPAPEHLIGSRAALRALYPAAGERALRKELTALDPHCHHFIALSPLVVIATCGADGRQDASPRGGAPGFVQREDDNTLLIGDAPGNNRLDTLENLLANPQLGLLFMLPGVDETLRVNGRAVLSLAPGDLQRCADAHRQPRLVIRVTVQQAYLHCAKALMRSRLWQGDAQLPRERLPTMGQMIRDQTGMAGPLESQAAMLQRYQADL
jgi:hypothetical protein